MSIQVNYIPSIIRIESEVRDGRWRPVNESSRCWRGAVRYLLR